MKNTRLVFDVLTNEYTDVPFTEEEVTQRELAAVQRQEQRLNRRQS